MPTKNEAKTVCVCGVEMQKMKDKLKIGGVEFPGLVCPACGRKKFVETELIKFAKMAAIEPVTKKLFRSKNTYGVLFPASFSKFMGLDEEAECEMSIEAPDMMVLKIIKK